MARSRVTRRRLRPMEMQRKALGVVGLLLLQPASVGAGRLQIEWKYTQPEQPTAIAIDAAGDIVVGGCVVGDEVAYVAKWTASGELLWRTNLDFDGAGACAVAVTTDSVRRVFVAGTVATQEGGEDVDVFVGELDPAGTMTSHRTLGTPFRDVPTCIRVHGVGPDIYVAGYSLGHMGLPPAGSDGHDEGFNRGFVAKLSPNTDSAAWIHTVVSRTNATDSRVFDLVVDPVGRSVVVVGETTGDVSATPHGLRERHQGDVFVRRLDWHSGNVLWTNQLGSPSVTDFCQLPGPSPSRGRCGIAFHPGVQELTIVGSTNGLISTFPSQAQQHRVVCGVSAVRPCVQVFVARLHHDTGSVRWVKQLVNSARTTAQSVVALTAEVDDQDEVAVVAMVSAGFFSVAESMEQIAVLRVARDGFVWWSAELGLPGEDYAADSVLEGGYLLVLGHGTQDKTRRGLPSTESYVRRLRLTDGSSIPMCVDRVFFDRDSYNVTRGAGGRAVLVQFRVERSLGASCLGTEATAQYRYRFGAVDQASYSGRVRFGETQTRAIVAVAVPSNTDSTSHLSIALEATSTHSEVAEYAGEWSIALEEAAEAPSSPAADGKLWRELSWISMVVAVVITGVAIALGRFCWWCRRCSWRQARSFEYRTLRARHRATTDPSTSTEGCESVVSQNDVALGEDEETDELRSHLEEIQQLNHSLDGLLHAHSAGGASSSLSPLSTSRKGPNWKRSLRALMQAPMSSAGLRR